MSSDSPSKPPALNTRDILKIRDFRLLWLGQSTSEFGNTLTNFALFILINRLTGSTIALAGLGIVLLIPAITFGLISGVYVDRLDRKQIMIISDLLRAGLVLGFVFIDSASQIWLIYLIAFLQASIGTMFGPAQGALMPNLVPKEGLIAANTLMQTSRFIAETIGTAGAGVIIGFTHHEWPAFVLDGLSFIIAPLLVSRISINTRSAGASTSRSLKSIWPELKQGMGVIFASRILVGVLVAVGVAQLGAQSFQVLFRVLMLNELGISESELGLILSIGTITAIFSSSIGGIIVKHIRPARVISGGLVILGINAMLTYFVADALSAAGNRLAGYFFSMPINVALAVLIQTNVVNEVRGRVGAAFNTIISVTSLISLAGAGVLAQSIGIRAVFALAGFITIVAGIAAAWVFEGKSKIKSKLEQAYEKSN